MSDLLLLPVTPTMHTAKNKNAISQQLMGRFRSSFEELKPYPYVSEIVMSNYTKLNIHCVIVIVLKVPTFFRALPLSKI